MKLIETLRLKALDIKIHKQRLDAALRAECIRKNKMQGSLNRIRKNLAPGSHFSVSDIQSIRILRSTIDQCEKREKSLKKVLRHFIEEQKAIGVAIVKLRQASTQAEIDSISASLLTSLLVTYYEVDTPWSW